MRSLKIFLILGLAVLLIGFIPGCGLFKAENSVAPDMNGDNDCQYPLYPETGNVGDTIRSCHFEITLHQAKYIDIEYRGPRVWVDATIKLEQAIVGNGAHIFTDCFTVQDSNGKIYSWGGLGDNNQLKQVTLFEGQEISGTTTIQVDKNASGFTAIFRESRMAGPGNYEDVLKWKLGF